MIRSVTPTLLLFGLVVLLPVAVWAQSGSITIDCPVAIDPPVTETFIDIPIHYSCDENMGGFTFGFYYDSPDIEIDSFHFVGSTVPFPNFFQFLKYPAQNMVLIGWTDFTFVNPITPTTDGLLMTFVARVPAGTPAQCIDVDSLFVPPAGYFIFAPAAGGQLTPDYYDCGDQEIDIGESCGAEPVPPVAICAGITVSADVDCQADASIDDGSYDPEGQDITLTQAPPGPYSPGETTVKLIVTDIDGYADTCEATVTVEDVTPPVVTCPGDITMPTEAGICAATVTYSATAEDNCGVESITYNPASGTQFPLGTTQVEVIATDAAGLADTCYFNVIVEDQEPPALTCPGEIAVSNDAGACGAVVGFEAAAEDNCGVENITYSQDPGTLFDVGTTQVMVIAYDASANADTCYLDVIVADDESPTAQCPGDITVNNDPGQEGAVVDFTATVSDNCPGATISCEPASGSFFPLGATTVECTATDGAGNTDDCSFLVTVNFVNSPPVARDSAVVTNEDTPVACQMQAYDPDGDAITYAVLDGPLHGIMSGFDMNTGAFTYTPNLAYLGPDTLFFQAFDGTDSSNVSHVSILVSGGGKTVIIPPAQYVYSAFAIDPWIDTIYFGNLPGGHTAGDVDAPSVTVNGSLVPTATAILPGYDGFVGEVMCLTFPLPSFILPYGALYDTTVQAYTVEGQYVTGMPFVLNGEVTIYGKNSHDPGKYLVPPDEVVLRGDIDKNGRVNMSDATALLAFIFGDGAAPMPRLTADADCSVNVNISDAVYLVAYIFGQADPPCPVNR